MACCTEDFLPCSPPLQHATPRPLLPHSAHRAACIAAYFITCFTLYLKLDDVKQASFYAWRLASAYASHDSLHLAACSFSLFVACVCVLYRLARPPPCYLVDFCCIKGDDHSCANMANFGQFLRTWKSVTYTNLKFQFKVLLKAGVGEETYVPPKLLQKGENVDMKDARVESETAIVDAAHRLLQKTRVHPKEIDIVIVNSSLFNPVPSLAAHLVNMLSLRSNVKSYNLAGMGCSASLIAIDLASRLLKVHRNAYALVLSTENITKNMYFGNDRSMMVSNCLFRYGCSAMLLTSKSSARSYAKMQLLHCLRTNLAADNNAFECVRHMEDSDGKLGVSLQASLLQVAGSALRTNITKLAPSILPWGELIKVAVSLLRKQLINKAVQTYEPDFKKAIDHFLIHPGGRAVIDSIGKGLKLSDSDVEPGRMALERFGNTSSSGIWYALAYSEAKGRLRKGNKVWQIALGSGFKCNSGVWQVLRDIETCDSDVVCNPWLSCIDRYPVAKQIVEDRAEKSKDIDAMLAEQKITL